MAYRYSTKACMEKEIEEAREQVEDLQQQAALQRQPVSQTAAALFEHIQANQDNDPLVNPEAFKAVNPFLQPKRRFCTIL